MKSSSESLRFVQVPPRPPSPALVHTPPRDPTEDLATARIVTPPQPSASLDTATLSAFASYLADKLATGALPQSPHLAVRTLP